MRILQPSATRQLLAAIRPRSPFGARDHALIRLFSQTGLRVGEMVGLDVGHVFHEGAARHQLDLPAAACKGHHSRVIPLNQVARQAIQDLVDFLLMRGFQACPDSPLLQDRRHRRLPAREVQRLVQTHRQNAGLDLRATPHSFRHTFASQLASKVSLRIVQQLLGHRFLASTEVYLHNQPVQLAQAVALLEPI
jgi:site-specific recombinase XerD